MILSTFISCAGKRRRKECSENAANRSGNKTVSTFGEPAVGAGALRIQTMNRKWLLLPLMGAIFCCASGRIDDHQPGSPQKAAVMETLIALERAWNHHDEEAVLELLDGDFVLWVWSGGIRKIVFRKGTFGFKLRDILIEYRYIAFAAPAVSIRDGEASAYVALSVDGRNTRSVLRLVDREGEWRILEWEWGS